MTTTTPQLRLRSVFDLLNERFFVASYQWGFRGKAQQVGEQLEDLAAFQLSSRQNSGAAQIPTTASSRS
jgi:hypothetical protein